MNVSYAAVIEDALRKRKKARIEYHEHEKEIR